MKAINWVRWLLAAGVCASLWSTTVARYKFRHPQQPQPQIYKKSWPMGPRVSMGNSVHMNMGPNGYKHNRPMQHKPTNFRYPPPPTNPVRRPPMFAPLPSWKSQLMGPVPNQGLLPQRGPVKEFHSMNKPAEYRPEQQQSIPSVPNRGPIDDDKGPIHTIPAPNLSPADKPYNLPSPSYPSNQEYSAQQNFGGNQQSQATNYVFGTQGTSTPHRITTGPTSPAPTLHRYEVTETNEIGQQDYRTVQPTFYTPEFDVTRLSNGVQSNDVFNRPSSPSNTGLIGTGIDFGQGNSPMQTNLHSSLHVAFPASAIQAQPSSVIEHQSPELHVGHPAPAGPPLSANQLYDLLNSFPQQFNEQYQSGQQQHAIQQQLDQIFQSNPDTQFSQPQMHSFNYDEQSNKKLQQQIQQQQQQQIFVGQDYASGRVTADYSLEPDTERETLAKKTSQRQDSVENSQSENNIEYEETSNRNGQSTYFTQIGDDGSLSSQFYTTLPSRDAAEKLAALAAAGNVNSQLIDHLRKQQHAATMPSNHKDDRYNEDAEHDDESRYQQQHPRYVNRQENEEQNQDRDRDRESDTEDKRPMRIMVPDLEDYSEDLDQRPARQDAEYEYEESDESTSAETAENPQRHQNSGNGNQQSYRQQLHDSDFGSRLGPKSK